MDVIYTVLEFLLPFEFIDYTFMEKCIIGNTINNTYFCNIRYDDSK